VYGKSIKYYITAKNPPLLINEPKPQSEINTYRADTLAMGIPKPR